MSRMSAERPLRRESRGGFSLLEIIIATAILAASGVMLMSMFSTADRHARRAESRAIAQMLCQSKLEELLASPEQILPIEADVVRQYPGWVYSVALEPTAVENFVRLTVSVTHIPGMEIGANLDSPTRASEQVEASPLAADRIPVEPTFQLDRWLEFEGDLTGWRTGTSAESIGESSEY